ncbi:MFS transporter [Paraglaciecola hydrolytica]|uniref:Major facilitator superfamily (MFS) profile domain-containing protein n=1 Tax=Paraglaciecola hydrolytica TaxID=1799789 RepID=A0A136A5U0_9ALTE|nr:MFS transporter [Paraglaciecola hydrolytica]KXI30607.1 hypothetical protein AX660_03975 [Paraglaciecola hydrolytica]
MKNAETQKTSYYGVLATLLLSTFIATLAISSTNILLPELVVSLHTTFSHVQWVTVSYLITMSSCLVISGSLSDLFGQRRLFIIGIVIFTSSAGLCGISNNIWLLCTFRATQGIGAAILITVNLAMISDFFPQHKVPAVIGLVGSMSAIGTACGPILGGFAAQWMSWQSVFLINLPIGLILLLLALYFMSPLKTVRQLKQKTFDYWGAIFLILTLVCFALSLKFVTEASLIICLALLSSTTLFLLLFIRTQTSDGVKLLNFSVLRDWRYSSGFVVNFLVSTVVMTSLVVSPFYLTLVFNLSVAQTGVVMTASPLCVAITSFTVSRMLSARNCDNLITTGVILLITGTICLSFFDPSFGIAGYIACLVITAVGYATFTSSNNTQIMTLASITQRGQISGLLNLSRNLGLLSGTTLMSSVFAMTTNITAIKPHDTFVVEIGLNRVYACATLLLVIALALRIYPYKKTNI